MRGKELRNLAEDVIKALENAKINKNYNTSALIGFFKGVTTGKINIGQEWPLNLLLNHQAVLDAEMIERIVATGMLCQGNNLGIGREASIPQL